MMLEDFYEGLNLLLKNKQLDKLEPYFIQSLEDAREVTNYTLYLTISNEMLAYFNSCEDLGKADQVIANIIVLMDELQKNILDSYENNFIKNEMAVLSIRLAFDYLKYHQLTKSKNSFMLAVEIFEKTNMLQEESYSAALTGLGEVHYELKEYDLAISFYKKALENMEINYGQSESYGMICDNIAAIYNLINMPEKASHYQAKLITIKKLK